MKALVSISLLLVLTFPFLCKTGCILHYYAYQDYYATELCVNKDKPKMCCAGSCQLSKELKAVETPADDQEASMPQIVKGELPSFIIPAELFSMDALPLVQNKAVHFIDRRYQRTCFGEIFHPPSNS